MAKLDLVGTFEVERDYDVPRYRVKRFIDRGLWPATVADLNAGGVWKRADVERALAKLKRDGLLDSRTRR